MSFLFEDDVLVKLLIDSKLFNQLDKYAQQADAETKILAIKLTKDLIDQARQAYNPPGADIYVRDLTSLESYINYLHKNKILASDGKEIVIQTKGLASGVIIEQDKNLYKPYHDFMVHIGGLIEQINTLDEEAQKEGNQVMRPLVNSLKAEATIVFAMDFTSKKKDIAHGGPSFAISKGVVDHIVGDDSDNITNKTKGTETGVATKSRVTVSSVTGSPPFGSDDMISPLDMHEFIVNMYNLLLQSSNNLPEIIGLRTQFATLQQNISGNYNDWQQFIDRMPPISNASNYRDHVPYDHSQPYGAFSRLFPGGATGSNNPHGNAREAGVKLLQMIDLTRQALGLMQRSPQLMSIFKDFIPSQLRRAQTFINGLQSFTG